MTIRTLWSCSLLAVLLFVIFLLPLVPVDVQRNVSVPFLNENGNNKAVVFFGFTHCMHTCPVTLGTLKTVIANADRLKTPPQVVFVDIDNNSNPLKAQQYAQQFHNSFIGIHPSSEQLNKLASDFGLNFLQIDKKIQHKGRTYLLNRANNEWKIVKAFNSEGLSADLLAKELY